MDISLYNGVAYLGYVGLNNVTRIEYNLVDWAPMGNCGCSVMFTTYMERRL